MTRHGLYKAVGTVCGGFLLLTWALITQGCHSKPPEVAEPTDRQQTVTVKVTKVERTERESNGVLWAELRFVASDGRTRYHFFANCNQNVNNYHCEFFTPNVGKSYVVELHREPSVSFCEITDDRSSTGVKQHYYTLEGEESMSWWGRFTE